MKSPSHWRDILTRKVIINLRDEPDWLIEFIRDIQTEAYITGLEQSVQDAARKLMDYQNCDGFKLVMGDKFIVCGTEQHVKDLL